MWFLLGVKSVVARLTETGNPKVAPRDKEREQSEGLLLRGHSCSPRGKHLEEDSRMHNEVCESVKKQMIVNAMHFTSIQNREQEKLAGANKTDEAEAGQS